MVGVTDSVADGGARSTEKLSWRDKSSAPPPEKEEEEKGEGATEEEEEESSSSTTLLLDSATEGISDVGRDGGRGGKRCLFLGAPPSTDRGERRPAAAAAAAAAVSGPRKERQTNGGDIISVC